MLQSLISNVVSNNRTGFPLAAGAALLSAWTWASILNGPAGYALLLIWRKKFGECVCLYVCVSMDDDGRITSKFTTTYYHMSSRREEHGRSNFVFVSSFAFPLLLLLSQLIVLSSLYVQLRYSMHREYKIDCKHIHHLHFCLMSQSYMRFRVNCVYGTTCCCCWSVCPGPLRLSRCCCTTVYLIQLRYNNHYWFFSTNIIITAITRLTGKQGGKVSLLR